MADDLIYLQGVWWFNRGDTPVEFGQIPTKAFRKWPKPVVEDLAIRVDDVEIPSLEEVRKCPFDHDETLDGSPQGQRSVRFTRACWEMDGIKAMEILSLYLLKRCLKRST